MKDDFYFNTNSEKHHRHDKWSEYSLLLSLLQLHLSDTLENWDEELLQMIVIKRKLIYVPKCYPVNEVSNQANQSGSTLRVDLLERSLYVMASQHTLVEVQVASLLCKVARSLCPIHSHFCLLAQLRRRIPIASSWGEEFRSFVCSWVLIKLWFLNGLKESIKIFGLWLSFLWACL